MERDDVKLIHDTLDGDETAFSHLVRKYQKSVHALAWRQIGDFHIAEEIAQDTFLQAYKKLSSLNNPRQFAGWLYVIADRCCKAWFRQKKLYMQSLETTDLETLEHNVYLDYVYEQREEEAAEYRRKVVQKLLEKLPESERTVTVLYYLGEMSCEAISKFLGVSPNTVRSRLKRARERLRQEESIIKETLSSVQLPTDLTENILQQIDRVKPTSPQGGKPLPWLAFATSALFSILLIGASNQVIKSTHQPYNLESTSETTIEIVERPIVFSMKSKPDLQNRVGDDSLTDRNNNDGQNRDTESVENNISKDAMQWNLPEDVKTRFGKGRIREITYSPDGSILAAAGDIGIWIYDASTYHELSMFPADSTRFDSLIFINDYLILASGGGDEVFLQWDKNDEILKKAYNRIKNENGDDAYNPNRQTFKSDDSTIALWNLDGKIKVNKMTKRIEHTNENTDDNLLVVTDGDKTRQLDINRLRHKNNEKVNVADFVSTVAFSPDQSIMASSRSDYDILLWDTPTQEHRKTLPGHTSNIKSIEFSPDAKTLVSSGDDGTIRFWEVETGTLKKTLTDYSTGIKSVSFSPDGNSLASTNRDGTIDIWNVTTRKKQNTMICSPDKFEYSVFNPNGQIITYGNGKMSVMDTDELKRKMVMKEHQEIHCLAMAPDGDLIATAHENSNIIIWNAQTIKSENILTKHSSRVYSVAFNPDGKTLASASDDNTLRIWDAKTGEQKKVLTGHTGGVKSVVFSPDGETLASGDSDSFIILWDIATGGIKRKLNGHSASVLSLVFSPDVNILASAGADNVINLWDVNSGELRKTLNGHTNQVRDITFSPDGETLASCSDDGTVLIWNIKQLR